MNEQKTPRKPLIYYAILCFLVLMLLNSLLVPMMQKMQIKEVGYSTFLTMLQNGEISQVQYEDNPVSYTHLDVYKRQVLCSIRNGRRSLGSFLLRLFAGTLLR